MSQKRSPDSRPDSGAGQRVKDFIERALDHHAQTGEWLPDPLLDEVAEMRRNVLAEYGGDYQKLWQSYIDLDREGAEQEAASSTAEKQKRSAA
jgi:hypothetical protein